VFDDLKLDLFKKDIKRTQFTAVVAIEVLDASVLL
jgi:hypothetical protein